MAKRRYSRSKKIQPAVLTMQFELTNSGNDSYVSNYIDLSQCASALNRRFYRQGIIGQFLDLLFCLREPEMSLSKKFLILG